MKMLFVPLQPKPAGFLFHEVREIKDNRNQRFRIGPRNLAFLSEQKEKRKITEKLDIRNFPISKGRNQYKRKFDGMTKENKETRYKGVSIGKVRKYLKIGKRKKGQRTDRVPYFLWYKYLCRFQSFYKYSF